MLIWRWFLFTPSLWVSHVCFSSSGDKKYWVKQVKYLREKTASVNVLPGKGSKYRDRHGLFSTHHSLTRGPYFDWGETDESSGAKLGLLANIRAGWKYRFEWDTVIQLEVWQPTQISLSNCAGEKCWVCLLLNKTTCLALETGGRMELAWGTEGRKKKKIFSKVTFYHRDGRLKRTFLLLLMAKGCCNPGKSLRNGSGRSAPVPEAGSNLSEIQCSDC